MKFRSFLAFLAVCGSLASPAIADETFRCGKWLVTSELTPEQLAEKCGPPTFHDSRTEDVMVRNRNTGLMVKTGETRIETWTYDRGTQAPPMVVTIVDGRIKRIERQKK
jgi:hypothetical protein